MAKKELTMSDRWELSRKRKAKYKLELNKEFYSKRRREHITFTKKGKCAGGETVYFYQDLNSIFFPWGGDSYIHSDNDYGVINYFKLVDNYSDKYLDDDELYAAKIQAKKNNKGGKNEQKIKK